MTIRKHKMTGFSRLLIFMLFFVPVAYIGASYYNGEDGIQNIKNILGIGKENSSVSSGSTSDCAYELRQKELEIIRLKEMIAERNNSK